MITINTNSLDPYYNLAAEEFFLYQSHEDIFMLWQNQSTAVIGRNQNVYAEINIPFANKSQITIVRRITGGGAVYHDLGNVNYTFITSREKSGVLNFEYFTSPIISALEKYGINAELSGRNDILCNGAKISGNAQFSTDTRILHHGTLLFDSDLSVMPSLLTVDPDKIKSKAIKSVKSRVTNLKPLFANREMSVNDFMDLIQQYVQNMYNSNLHQITPEENAQILEIRKKYACPDWTFTPKGNYQNRSKKYFPFGLVDIYYSVKNSLLEQINICGDFFGQKDICQLENIITGVPHKKTAVEQILSNIKISEYISSMTNADFINMLFE